VSTYSQMGNIDLFSWNEIKENEISRNENPSLFGIKKEGSVAIFL